MTYVINLVDYAGDGSISSTLAIADTNIRALAIAKALMLKQLANEVDEEDVDPRIHELAELTGLKEGLTSGEYLQIAWTLNMTVEDLWEIYFDYCLNFDGNPQLEIRNFAENGMDFGGYYFSRKREKQKSRRFRLYTKIGDIAPLSLLPDTLTVLYDSQDIEIMRTMVKIPEGVTAVAIETEDGDYVQVWMSESSTPYFDSAIYERIL